MSNDQLAKRAFEPADIEQAKEISKILCASRLLPKAIQSPEAAFAVIVCGRELGLTAMQSLRGIHIVEGKPVLASDTMLALALQSEKCEYFQCIESSGDVATYATKRRAAPKEVALSFTIEQARAAQVATKDNWRKYPDAMLRARCIAALARMVYPDVFMGIYDPDELAQDAPVHAPAQVVQRGPKTAKAPAPMPPPEPEVKPAPHVVADAEIVEEKPAEPAKAVEPTPTPAPPSTSAKPLTTLEDFLSAIADAKSIEVLNMISKQAINAKPSKSDFDTIRTAWGKRNAALKPVAA